MKRSKDDELTLCLHCRRVRHPDEPGWEAFDIQATRLWLCPTHGPAFCLGMDWADRRNRIATTQVTPPANAEEGQPKAGVSKERLRRAEARLARIFQWNMTPKEVFAELSRWVAGQDAPKRTLATALRGHLRRIQMRMIEETRKPPPVRPDLLPRQCILCLGPTGSGKSLASRTIARTVDLPYWGESLAKYTAEGWVGNSADELLTSLLLSGESYGPTCEKGILFLDELDKKSRRSVSGVRDVSGEDLQFSLLEMLDTAGSTVFISPAAGGRRNPNQALVEFNTRDLMFVLAGAFVGLAPLVAEMEGGKRRLGFGCASDKPVDAQLRESEWLHRAEAEHVVAFGLIPELVARIGSFAVFDPLSVDDLRHIMLEVEDAVVKMHRARAEVEGFDLHFTPEAVDSICQRAYASGMGARRLRSLTAEVLEAIFFELPQATAKGPRPRVIVTAATVEDPSSYEVVRPRRTTAPTAPEDAKDHGGDPPQSAMR